MKNLLNSKYPNIRVRLISGLLILLMLTSFLGILYIIDTRLLNQVTENILEHPFTVNNSVKDIGIYLNAMHRSMKDLTLAKNENELNDAILKINSYELIVYEKFDLIFERFLGRPKYVTDVYNEFIKWKPIRDRVIELVKKQKYEEAAEITKDQGAIHVDLLINKTQTMIEFANTKAIEFNNNSISILKSAYRKAILLFFIAILLWALIFVWLIRSITIPLKRIITQIKNISPDYFISKPPESNNILVMLEYVVSEQKNYKILLENAVTKQYKEIVEARNLLESAIDNAPIGMAKVGLDGKYIQANQEFCNMTGYTQEKLKRLTFNDITHEEDKALGTEFVKKLLAGKIEKGNFEKRYIHKSGNIIHCSLSSMLVKDAENNPQYIFSQLIDITEQKKREKELIKHKEDLEGLINERTREIADKALKLIRSQKALTYLVEDVNESREKLKFLNKQKEETNKELETFSYSVSHDLKAPLRAIDGFSQALEEDCSDNLDEKGLRYLKVIRENVQNMGTLINDLLEFSRLGRKALHLTEVDLKEIAKNVINKLLSTVADRNIKINIKNLPAVKADYPMMQHVMYNLLSNAIKFSAHVKQPEIQIGFTKKNNKNIYYVKDNGVGFDMKYSEKVFMVFQRLHSANEFEGTGIGMAIVQRIIHKHEGEIWVQSEINKGTTFYFTM